MRQGQKDLVARRFSNIDFHDDALVSVKVHAPRRKGDSAKIILEFRDDASGAKKVLRIGGCANLRWLMDFDVLACNWYAQTERATFIRDAEKMRKFVHAQTAHWHVKFMPPSPKHEPIRRKISNIRKYVLFRVTFYGGTMEVLAKNFKVTLSRRVRSLPAK
jgi:hypothetical protein